jgi:4-diphosphocytidyl-2-C-methyl-D-erythritol kinase
MGGGSSDAASTLLALNCLWDLNWPRDRLLALGATLGADVPFFIGGHNAFVEGIGERLTPIGVPRMWLAVVKPAAALETRAIFASPQLVRDTEAVILEGSLAGTALGTLQSGTPQHAVMTVAGIVKGQGRNDLQGAAIQQCPTVAEAAQWLERRFGNSRMTGSGSAVFARAGTGDQPVATFPAELPPEWEGRMCRSLEAHPLAGWAAD